MYGTVLALKGEHCCIDHITYVRRCSFVAMHFEPMPMTAPVEPEAYHFRFLC